MGIPIRRLHFKESVSNVQNRNIKRAATQIINRNFLILLLVQAVGQRSRRRLVDDSENFQTRNLPSVLRGLALTVVEVSRHRDHRLRNLFTQLRFRIRF